MFLMPLIAPLLLVRNCLYRANVRITHYIATKICPRLPGLGWSKYVEERVPRNNCLDLTSYRMLNFYYLTIAIIPSLVFISGNRSIGFRILQCANIVIGIMVASTTLVFTRHKLLKKFAEKENRNVRN